MGPQRAGRPEVGGQRLLRALCPSTDGEQRSASAVGLLSKPLGLLPSAGGGAEPKPWFETPARARNQLLELGNSRLQWDPLTRTRAALKVGAFLVTVRQGDVVSWALSTS